MEDITQILKEESKELTKLTNILRAGLSEQRKNWDGLSTMTTNDHEKCEELCCKYLIPVTELTEEELQLKANEGLIDCDGNPLFVRQRHISYLENHFGDLGFRCTSQASSKPWIYYHVLNSLDLLDVTPSISIDGAIRSINSCRTVFGGYAGSKYEYPHTMTTYAAINSLVSIRAYDAIHRSELYRFFLSMKQINGSFSVHVNGESDCRSTYCVLAVCRLLHMLTPQITRNVKEFFLNCQTYEGGFGGRPCTEAHGGYTYCAVAGLSILDSLSNCDILSLEKWLCDRQCVVEGGFNGRTNKLVDGCYSWYVGSALHMMSERCNERHFFDEERLEQYALRMEQLGKGGLRDKPDMRSDLYHTMYCLCGMSVAGSVLVKEINCVQCVEKGKADECMRYFSSYSNSHDDLMNNEDGCIRIEFINNECE